MRNPLNPGKKADESRFIEEIARKRMKRPETESLIELIQTHAKKADLSPPLYTARAQQQAMKEAQNRTKQKPAGSRLEKLLQPLVTHEKDAYEDLIELLLQGEDLSSKDTKELKNALAKLKKMKEQLSKRDLSHLSDMIETLHLIGDKQGTAQRRAYWNRVAMMYSVMAKMSNQLAKSAKSEKNRKLLRAFKEQAEKASGLALAKSEGHESLAKSFIEGILGHYMPQEEAILSEIAALLQANNFGADSLDSLLNIISDFSTAGNDFSGSSFMHGADAKGNYPDGQGIKNQIDHERTAAARDKNQLQNAQKKLQQELKEVNQKLKNEKDPKVRKVLEKLKGQLQNDQTQISACLKNINALQAIIGTPDHPGPLKVTINPDGTATITPKGAAGNLQKAENAVVNGDAKGVGGLSSLYNKIHGDQQEYSNMSQSEQMKLQLTMTEVQQAWTIVATCMTTLNQTMLSLAQSVYK